MVRLKVSRLGLDFERRKLLMIELTKNNWTLTRGFSEVHQSMIYVESWRMATKCRLGQALAANDVCWRDAA